MLSHFICRKKIKKMFGNPRIKIKSDSYSFNQILTVTSSGSDVSDSVGSLGEGLFEVLLGVRIDADEGSEVRSKSGLDLASELTIVFLVKDLGFISLINFITGAWGEVELLKLGEKLVGPGLDSADVLVGSGGVVVHEVDEGGGVALDLVQSLTSTRKKGNYQ